MQRTLLALGGPVARATRALLPADGSLTPLEQRVFTALLARLFRADGDDLPSTTDVAAIPFLDGLARKMDDATRGELALLLVAVEHLLPRLARHVRPFTSLDGASQDAVLETMEGGPVVVLRGALDALKSLCAMAYLRDPRTWGAIGYDGPLRDRPPEGWVATARLTTRAGR